MKLKDIITQSNLEFPGGGTDKNSTHCYIEYFYEEAFEEYRDKEVSILEIGISGGYSFRLWKEYFKNAKTIIGIDNRPEAVAEVNRSIPGVEFYYGDAYTQEMVDKLPKFDIIIDDGCHKTDYQVKAMELYLPLLKEGGLYVIEDIQHEYPKYSEFEDPYGMLQEAVPDEFTYVCHDLREVGGRQDDSMMAIRHV